MALPTVLDFALNPAATPARMNAAMEYLTGRLRAVEAIQPEFLSTINQLKSVGLDRLAEALIPVFDQANEIGEALQAIKDVWEADLLPSQVIADVTAAVETALADYRNRYHGALAVAPTTRPDGTPVEIGDTYFDTALDSTRVLAAGGWKDAGSSVAGMMRPFGLTATAGQTVFTVPDGYDVGFLIVAVNGSLLEPGDYTATNGTTIVFPSGLSVGDSVSGVAFGQITLASVYTKAQGDARYALIGAGWTKAEADARFALIADAYTKAASDLRYIKLDFSNLPDASAARTSLGCGTAATRNDAFFVKTGTGVTGAISAGTAAPSGGANGDVYLRYT